MRNGIHIDAHIDAHRDAGDVITDILIKKGEELLRASSGPEALLKYILFLWKSMKPLSKV